MAEDAATRDCPCGSGEKLAACCEPYVGGAADPPTAEATMRSRYTAFVLGEVDYVLSSHHPDTRDQVDRDEVTRWSRQSDWLGLRIEDTEAGGPDDDEGTVTFRARYRLDGQLVNHRERAHFVRLEGRWSFHSAEQPGAGDEPELVPVGPASTVGRNDPCPCGSGKKYKKCHGAAA